MLLCSVSWSIASIMLSDCTTHRESPLTRTIWHFYLALAHSLTWEIAQFAQVKITESAKPVLVLFCSPSYIDMSRVCWWNVFWFRRSFMAYLNRRRQQLLSNRERDKLVQKTLARPTQSGNQSGGGAPNDKNNTPSSHIAGIAIWPDDDPWPLTPENVTSRTGWQTLLQWIPFQKCVIRSEWKKRELG